jgi:hypothetical protein
MSRKALIILLVLTALLAGGLLLAEIRLSERTSPLFDEGMLSQIKQGCSLTEGDHFEDQALGIRFKIRSDLLVCDLHSLGQTVGTRQIYLWKKDSFNTTVADDFFGGIVGEVSVNLPQGAPGVYRVQPGTVVSKEAMRIAGVATTIQVTEFPDCNDTSCPTARIALLRHNGNSFVLGENDAGVVLLESFEFIH